MWTIAVSGKKKLRIQKYRDTCGRGLSILSGEGHAGREMVTLTISTDGEALQCTEVAFVKDTRAQFNLLLLDVYNGGHR